MSIAFSIAIDLYYSQMFEIPSQFNDPAKAREYIDRHVGVNSDTIIKSGPDLIEPIEISSLTGKTIEKEADQLSFSISYSEVDNDRFSTADFRKISRYLRREGIDDIKRNALMIDSYSIKGVETNKEIKIEDFTEGCFSLYVPSLGSKNIHLTESDIILVGEDPLTLRGCLALFHELGHHHIEAALNKLLDIGDPAASDLQYRSETARAHANTKSAPELAQTAQILWEERTAWGFAMRALREVLPRNDEGHLRDEARAIYHSYLGTYENPK
jgi:hypothetical protein